MVNRSSATASKSILNRFFFLLITLGSIASVGAFLVFKQKANDVHSIVQYWRGRISEQDSCFDSARSRTKHEKLMCEYFQDNPPRVGFEHAVKVRNDYITIRDYFFAASWLIPSIGVVSWLGISWVIYGSDAFRSLKWRKPEQ